MKKMIYFVGVALLLMGCTHPLRITNEKDFKASYRNNLKPVNIGFLPCEEKLLNSVIEEMSLSPAVRKVKKNCHVGSWADMDYVSELSYDMKYRSSGENFLITIPGFIIFTHAWLGYKYYIDIDTQSRLLDQKGELLNEASIITPYEIRYTSFARGATSSLIGWCTPGWGALDIIPGVVFATSYDHRATPEFIDKVKPSYKGFVSSKIIDQVAAVQSMATSGLKSEFRMETVVVGDEMKRDMVNGGNDRHYAIYVAKVEEGWLLPHKNEVRELPEETVAMMNKMSKNETMLDSNSVKDILLSLDISGIEYPKDMNLVSIYTMQGDQLVSLFNGNETGVLIAGR